MRKYLSKDIWNQLKEKNDSYNFSFREAIFSGIRNTDSGIGVYAGSHDAYTKFNKLFDQVIQDYHNHGPEDMHVSDMNADGLENAEFNEADSAMVASTRIRVGRNLAGYPLGPGVSKEQRLEICTKVVEACNTFEGDLAGKYYSLADMKEADRIKLTEEHHLFK